MRIILGSQSPRRKEILSQFNIPFTQASSNFDEESIPFSGDPGNFACKLAECKEKTLRPAYPKSAILTADTIVYCDNKLYGKPATEKEACRMFAELQGRWHSVFTGVALSYEDQLFSQYEESRVLFNHLSPNQIKAYHRTSNWSDKAGGYGIQAGGGLLIKKIDGCFYNVMGLPVNTVRDLFNKIGIDLWDYLK